MASDGPIDRYLDALRAHDEAAMARLRSDGFVDAWPQLAPGGSPPRLPTIEGVRRVVGDGDIRVLELATTDDARPGWLVQLVRLREERITRVTTWLGRPFEAAAWRSALVDRFDARQAPAVLPHQHSLSDAAAAELAERYWEAAAQRDYATIAVLRHPDWVADWPQSGERVPSHAIDVAIHSTYPGYPRHGEQQLVGLEDERWLVGPLLAPVRLAGAGSLLVAQGSLDYPDGSHWLQPIIVELLDGRIRRDTQYFVLPFEAPGAA